MPRQKKDHASTGAVSFNMTPMIDIVFNLLIFFILTSQFSQLEIEQVTLPLSMAAENKETDEYLNVVINLTNPDNPQCVVSGQPYDYLVREEPNELTRLLMSRKERAAGRPLNVILRADEMIPYEAVASVMLAAGRAEIEGWWITTDIADPEEVLDEK